LAEKSGSNGGHSTLLLLLLLLLPLPLLLLQLLLLPVKGSKA